MAHSNQAEKTSNQSQCRDSGHNGILALSNQAEKTSITWWINFDVKSKAIQYDYTVVEIYKLPEGHNYRIPARPRNRLNDYRQVDHLNVKPYSPIPVGPGLVEYSDSSVNLQHSGFELWHCIHVPDSSISTPNSVLGDTENLRITAKVRSTASCQQNLTHGFSLDDDTVIYQAITPAQAKQLEDTTTQAKKISDFNYYTYLNPILYIQQPNGGFLLFAELMAENGWCRMLFSAMQQIPDQHKPAVTGKFFPVGQLTVISTPYRATDEFRTLELKQDGDVFCDAFYLEFRANTYSEGIFRLNNPQFPFMGEEKSHVGIGYWPRTDREALYFHGDIKSIECDPHGLCPCAG